MDILIKNLIEQQEGYLDVPGGRIWYVRMGSGSKTPLVVLHGGPGMTHDSLKVLQALAHERPVIFYDQLGSGNSDRPTDSSLWNTERFVDELDCVLTELHLNEFHLLGHSWGTMLAASYLLDRPPAGIRSVIFSSPCLSAERWKADADVLLSRLPEDIQQTIARNEAQGTTDSDEYKEAVQEYFKRHVIRLDPIPAFVLEGLAKGNSDVYMTMWGPSEFSPTGNLNSFDCLPQLHRLNVPSLFVCGRHDEATPETTRYYQSLVHNSALHIFENSSHASYLEETDEYIAVIRRFLADK